MGCKQSKQETYYIITRQNQVIGITSDFKKADVIFQDYKEEFGIEFLECVLDLRTGRMLQRQLLFHTHSYL